jgi:hypothetical protein
MMTCSVCKRTGSDVTNYKSTLNGRDIPYCLDCINSGREPYIDLVSFGWEFDMFSKTYQQKIIIPTLYFNNKTIEQFNDEVRLGRENKNASSAE